jgi:class 3 adenylate cyclase
MNASTPRGLVVSSALAGAVADLPRGTVTTVFTDIEGSTQLLRELGKEGYREELELHRALLREVFGRHGGREVEMQGDGFHFAFARASDAVAAAAEAQRELAAVAWPRGEPIRIRVGIHTGEPAATEGLYVGLDIHHAARVMAAAHGGQVLLSEATALLAREELPPELSLRDLGQHHLKDFVATERLYQLGNEDFPPLRTDESVPVPAPDGGRPRAELTKLLRRRRVRALAILAGVLIAGVAAVAAVLGFPGQSTPVSIGVKTDLGNVSGFALTNLGLPVQIQGKVPSGEAGVGVELQASTFPFRGFTDVRRATSTNGGVYTLSARPALATRYRVALYPSEAPVSHTVTVYVTTQAKRSITVYKRQGRIDVRQVWWEVEYPASVATQEAAKPIYFYSGVRDKRGGWPRDYRLKLERKLRQHSVFQPPGSKRNAPVPYTFFFREPSLGSRLLNAVAYCAKDTEAVDGFGLPGHHRCGNRFIPDRNDPRAFPNIGYLG